MKKGKNVGIGTKGQYSYIVAGEERGGALLHPLGRSTVKALKEKKVKCKPAKGEGFALLTEQKKKKVAGRRVGADRRTSRQKGMRSI